MKRHHRKLRSHLKQGQFWRSPRLFLGYTLLEVMVTVMVVGIVATVAVPSFASLLDSMKVNQTVAELRTSFQDSQRQAIRKNQICTVQLSTSIKNWRKNSQSLSGKCLTSASGDKIFPEGIALATNLKPSLLPSLQNWAITSEVKFGNQGSAEFSILSAARPPLTPKDPTGKIVALAPDNPKVQKKCVAISSTLGLTRVGVYTGSTNPTEITDTGICTALDWKEQ